MSARMLRYIHSHLNEMAMNNDIQALHHYISEIQKILKTGDAREHAYRPAFQALVEALTTDIQVINEPAYTGGNAPDFLFKKGDTPIAYAECKDITVDISKPDIQKQAKRYVDAFGKILLTNYLDIEIIDEQGSVVTLSLGHLDGAQIVPVEAQFEACANVIRDYMTSTPRTIRSAKKLAEIMANKAQILRDNALASLSENTASDIFKQYRTFQEVLIRDLSEEEFADMYAQTLVYGLFVARYYDPTLPTFSRYEAQDLLPATNPLLKKFFGHVAGTDYDPKIAWIVDSLIETYLATDVAELMHREFEKKSKDPVLHFYETFLSEYDKGLRKSRGVYYTPEPVVSFIVRSVDQILKSKFNLLKGLSDTSKIPHMRKIQATDGRTLDGVKQVTSDIHKVQILDPAVGTGTFLNEVIHEIYKGFAGQEGMWPGYVKEHLLPRLHGFELMMASYTMAHLKLGVTLSEMGYTGDERLSVWLTNSLEQGVHEVPNLFMSEWLTDESNNASYIKSDLPIMVVIGNPPYSGVSSNNSKEATRLADKYKIEPGGKQKLQERKHWLNDDYVKFISFAEDQIEKTGEGIVAFVTNHGYIDNPTFRGMRWHLLKTFDEIYILDLHGNSLKKETAPDGGKDENVFHIQQGVSIIFGIKKKTSTKELGDVYHFDMYGKRDEKYKVLNDLSFEKVEWEQVENREPNFTFVSQNYRLKEHYQKGFSILELLGVNTSGVVTMADNYALASSKKNILDRIKNTIDNIPEENEFKEKWKLGKNYPKWFLGNLKNISLDTRKGVKILYRPFDSKWTYYDRMVLWRDRHDTLKNLAYHENIGLIFARSQKNSTWNAIFVSNTIMETKAGESSTQSMIAPLYLYADDGTKTPNLDKEIWRQIDEMVGKTEPEDVLDYIYAVLHSPSYREKYQEFLKIDFPRVPYPEDKAVFWKLVDLGRELRSIHLLESPKVHDFITTFSEGGSNVVEKGYPKYKDGNVSINESQYFGNVTAVAWNFYIGGYQPAQKWLKDRRERELSTEDIAHYQQMIVALSETDRLMGEVDDVWKMS